MKYDDMMTSSSTPRADRGAASAPGAACTGNRPLQGRGKTGAMASFTAELPKNKDVVLQGHVGIVYSVCRLPDGRLASGSGDKKIRIWSLEGNRRALQDLSCVGHTSLIYNVVALPDGRIASSSFDNTLRVWSIEGNVATCDSMITGEKPGNKILCLTVLPQGRLAGGCADGAIRIWTLPPSAGKGSKPPSYDNTLQGHTSGVCCLSTLPSGKIVSASHDTTLRVWSLGYMGGTCEHILTGHSKFINAIAVFDDGRIVSASDDKTLRVWSLDVSGKSYTSQVLMGHTAKVLACAVLPDGRIISGSSFGKLRIWSARELTMELVIEGGHSDSITVVKSLDGTGKVVTGSEDCTLRVIDVPRSTLF